MNDGGLNHRGYGVQFVDVDAAGVEFAFGKEDGFVNEVLDFSVGEGRIDACFNVAWLDRGVDGIAEVNITGLDQGNGMRFVEGCTANVVGDVQVVIIEGKDISIGGRFDTDVVDPFFISPDPSSSIWVFVGGVIDRGVADIFDPVAGDIDTVVVEFDGGPLLSGATVDPVLVIDEVATTFIEEFECDVGRAALGNA